MMYLVLHQKPATFRELGSMVNDADDIPQVLAAIEAGGYYLAGTIEADGEEDVFRATQNDFAPTDIGWGRTEAQRSTSVGDVYVTADGRAFVVAAGGHIEFAPTVAAVNAVRTMERSSAHEQFALYRAEHNLRGSGSLVTMG